MIFTVRVAMTGLRALHEAVWEDVFSFVLVWQSFVLVWQRQRRDPPRWKSWDLHRGQAY